MGEQLSVSPGMSESECLPSADILIVEDEAPIARLMSLHLKAAGLTIHCCADGNEALELLQAGQWRLLVLDRMLPGVSGMQILRRLKERPETAHLPVLMVTSL